MMILVKVMLHYLPQYVTYC